MKRIRQLAWRNRIETSFGEEAEIDLARQRGLFYHIGEQSNEKGDRAERA